MKFKRLGAFLLAGIMSMTAVGCGESPDEGNESLNAADADDGGAASETGELKGEITFSTWGSLDEKKINEEVIKAFEAKYPGTKVNLEFIPDKYREKIDTMFLGGNAPDVIYGHPHFFAAWAKEGLLMDLSERYEEEEDFYMSDKFATNMYDSFRYEGKNIATINGPYTFLLYYNKDLFDEAGVAYPTDEWTWDDWLEAAQKLTTTAPDGSAQYATVFSAENPATWFPYIYSFGGDIFDDMDAPTKVVFNSPETVEALQFIQDAVHKYGVAPNYQDSDLTGGAFDTGRVAMDIDGSWAPASKRNITEFKWDMANIPLKEGKERRTSAFYAGYAVNAATENPDLAYAFAKFFQEDEGQQILSQLGLITVINKEIASSEENLKGEGLPENHALRVSSIDYATNGYAMLTNWEEMMTKVLKPAFEELLSAKITPEECAERVQTQLEEMLAKE